MTARGLIVSAPRSGAGKTTVTLALIAALARRGMAVRAAKAGPDYIDVAFHAAATGAHGYNLDSWAMPPALLDALLSEAACGADVLIVEGVMGLFDGVAGLGGRCGATADLAARFALPVLLVVDVSGQSQSAAALVRGFASHDGAVRIAGVVLNRVGSERHRILVADAVAALDMPILGAVPREETLVLPERHLGLVQAGEHADLALRLDALAQMAERCLDLDAIVAIARPPSLPAPAPISSLPPPGQRIALARDAAFTFVYSHIVEGWREAGARDRPFLAARRRAAARRLRLLLASRRLSGAPCRRAGGGRALSRRAGAVCNNAPGAWGMRGLHRARRGSGGCKRRAPRHDGASPPCHELCAAQASSRLSRGAASLRRSDRTCGRTRARPRVPLCEPDRGGRRRAVLRAFRRTRPSTRAIGRTAR